MLRNERIREEITRLQEDGSQTAVQKVDGDTPAEKAEILRFLTEVMRDSEEADLKTRMKAAELLGKRERLFEKGKDGADRYRVVIVDDIP